MPIKPVLLTLICQSYKNSFESVPERLMQIQDEGNSEERWSFYMSPETFPRASLHFSELHTHGEICLHYYFKIKLLHQCSWFHLLSLSFLSHTQVMQRESR